jgi:carbon storage regulator
MLVLTRKAAEKIHIGNNIVISVVRIDGSKVRLGIEAPSEIAIRRAELTVQDWDPQPVVEPTVTEFDNTSATL